MRSRRADSRGDDRRRWTEDDWTRHSDPVEGRDLDLDLDLAVRHSGRDDDEARAEHRRIASTNTAVQHPLSSADRCRIKLAFHVADTDTDTDTDFLEGMCRHVGQVGVRVLVRVGVGVGASWNANFILLGDRGTRVNNLSTVAIRQRNGRDSNTATVDSQV